MAIEPIHSEPILSPSEGTRDSHPAFAVATVSRGHGTPRTLFQSDLQHNETITFRVLTAERDRSLHRDWVYPRETLVEVEMSLAQWGSLVSSMGLGSGVPVTLRSRESERSVAGLPFEPRIKENLRETREAVSELVSDIDSALTALEEAVESKAGVRAVRERLNTLRSRVNNAPSNAAFAVKSLKAAAEDVTSQARADIEAQILTAQVIVGGQASIDSPSTQALELEAE